MPPPRYSHGAAIVRTRAASGMIVTHGYNKDGEATWLSDTWFRQLDPRGGGWTQVALQGKKPGARLGHTLGEN